MTCPTRLPGFLFDVDGNGAINAADKNLVVARIGNSAGACFECP